MAELMTNPTFTTDSNQAFREVLVMRALPGLGDFLCVTPALRGLRAALPNARISLLGLPSTRELVARYRHLVDDLLEFPGFPGLPEVPIDLTALLALLQGFHGRFDLALQMHGSGTFSNLVVQLLGARTTAGFYSPPQTCANPRTFAPYPGGLAEPLVWLSLLEFLGMPTQGNSLEFPLSAADEVELEAVLRELGVPTDSTETSLAVVHVGASDPRKQLDPRVLAGVADGLAARGFAVVLTGARQEAGLAQALRGYASCRPFDLSGRTSVGALGALVRRAKIVVTPDTGVSHLASALRTPSVVVFSSGDVQRWAPLDRQRHRVVDGRTGALTIATILREAELALDVARPAKRVLVVAPACPGEDSSSPRPAQSPHPPGEVQFEQTLQRLRAELPSASVVLLTSGPSADPRHAALVDEVVPGEALTRLDPAGIRTLIDRLAAARFDAALVFTAADETAFDGAYLAYLAGIPVRAGLTTEFGGALLSACVHPPPGLSESRRDRFLLDQLRF
jgi:ADP-heptose:LPS heptosyltransferase